MKIPTFTPEALVLSSMLDCAREGHRVVPLWGIGRNGRCRCSRGRNCDSPGKHPIASLALRGVKDATTDRSLLRRWHTKFPQMNYGIALDGLTVIDIDSSEALTAFYEEFAVPRTRAVHTGRGVHLIFQGETQSRTGLRKQLDIKSGPDAYVAGAWSLHSSGRRYACRGPIRIVPLSAELGSVIRNESPRMGPAASLKKIPAGNRNSTLTSLAGALRRRGLPEEAITAALQAVNVMACEESLPEREVARLSASVSRYPAPTNVELRAFSDVADEILSWLWYPYISRGTLGLLDGDPGCGKSQFMIWLAAQLSRGLLLPRGDKLPPLNTFLLNLEDLPGAVIKKRLEANGADLNRVFIQSRRFQMTPEMVGWLEEQIQLHKASLVILDPIAGFMGGETDANSDVAVRDFLAPLADVAEREKCAIICVRHFGKSKHDKAMKNGLGSTGFVGIARNQFGLAKRDDGQAGFIVFHMKTNFEQGDAMLFEMSEANGRQGEQPRITFESFVKIDADEYFAAESRKRGPDQDEREVARRLLEEELADGPKPTSAIKAAAEARSISASTLDRARKELDVTTHRVGKSWQWKLPAKA